MRALLNVALQTYQKVAIPGLILLPPHVSSWYGLLTTSQAEFADASDSQLEIE
jgi:hypothetical protein